MFKKLILFNIILAFLIISPISAFNCDSNDTDILEANDNLNENIYYDNLNVSSLNDLNTNENLTNDKIIENNTKFEVPTQKQTLNFTVTTNTTPGGAVTINISTNSNATGNITLETAGKTINTKLINGSANEYLTANPGIYSINLDYSGDDNFNSASLSYFQKYLISDTSSALITPNSNLNMVYKNGTRFVVDLVDSKGNSLGTPDVKSLNRYIYITVNGQFYEKRVGINGTSLALNLRPGNYVINTFFEGDAIYPASNLSTNLTVLPDLLSSNFTKYYKNDSQYSVSVIDGYGNPIIGKKVKLNINGVFYDRETDSNGIAHLNINLRPGNYTLTAIHPLTSLEIGNTISVLTDLIGNDVTMEYNNGSQYSVMALDDYGNPITGKNLKLNINGVFYNRETDSNGIAHLNITLNPGNYIITAIHPYTDLAISNKINVLFKTNYTVDASNCFSNINLENVSTANSNTDEVYLDIQTNQLYRGESLNVYLKSNGEVLKVPNIPIQITINGVTYVRNTNNYGIAKLNINLNAQNNPYLVGLYFAGNDNYSGDSKLANLYVAQKNTILTFMSSAVNTGTPLKIKLTDSTYVPIANKIVKITINGVTYERTSNQYGIASLNINLNPQSYVVSTSFDSQGGYASFSTITKTISVII